MSDRIKWIDHKSHKILYSDYSGLCGEEMIPEIAAAEKKILNSGNNEVLVVNDFSGSFMNKPGKERGNELMRNAEARGMKVYVACVGISGIQRILVQVVVRDVYFAKNEEDAKDWLVRQALKEN